MKVENYAVKFFIFIRNILQLSTDELYSEDGAVLYYSSENLVAIFHVKICDNLHA
jgi:hypothetical protein